MEYCAECKVKACYTGKREVVPEDCPMKCSDVVEKSLEEYSAEIKEFARQAALLESEGYCRWTRVEETIRFCVAMKYQKIGLAFCIGLKKEAEILSKLFRAHGLTILSANCKFSCVQKEFIGISEEEKLRPGTSEVMCNPIAQALFFNGEKTDINVVMGLCVGHDSLFFKYSEAPCTVVLTKDRVLCHNPAAALYCSEGYMKSLYVPY
ncbi:MAG: DUF1847 domain-containing protein [Eubacteriales bacterium]|nr:DUF1847 domain-containing protein [Eubacteriales bacterium]